MLFKTDLLRTEIPNILDEESVSDILQSQHPESFKVELLLDSFKVGEIPNLEELSEIFEISRRTFERNLCREGTNFSVIKDKYLQRKSIQLLADSNASVKEIAQQLNYANSQNYIRSFKRWTGITPSRYRLGIS